MDSVKDFEKNILPDLDDGTDTSEQELAVFGGELNILKWNILENINRQQDSKDKKEADTVLNILQETNNLHDDTKKNDKSPQKIIPFNVQKNIEEKIGNENPLANQWRGESYMKVSNFATIVAQQWWFFGRLTSWFS